MSRILVKYMKERIAANPKGCSFRFEKDSVLFVEAGESQINLTSDEAIAFMKEYYGQEKTST